MAVLPERARLIVQRQLCNPLGELCEVEITGVEVCGRISLADEAIAIKAVGDSGRVSHQVQNGRRPVRRNQFERLGAIIGFFLDANLHISERGNVLRHRLVELELALVHQRHSGHAGDGFGH